MSILDSSLIEDLQRYLQQPPRTSDAVGVELREVEAALARVEQGAQRLESLVALQPERRADPRLHDLRDRLGHERDGLLTRWCRLLHELRQLGGTVEWTLPVQAPSALPLSAVPQGAVAPSALPASTLPAPGAPLAAAMERGPDNAPTAHLPAQVPGSLHVARQTSEPAHPQAISTPHTAPTRQLPMVRATPAVPVDVQQLTKLQAALRGESAAVRPQSQPFDAPRWLELSSHLGELPTDLSAEAAVKAEFKRLEKFAKPERLTWVAEMPRDVQCLLIGHLVARARTLQEPPAVHHLVALDLDKAMEGLFSSWTSHQRTHQPGFVHGLGRHHTAEKGSWTADARALWHELAERATILADEPALNPERELRALEQLLEARADAEQVVAQLDVAVAAGVGQEDPRLVRLLQPWPDVVKFARFKTLRRAIRATEEAEDVEVEEHTPGPPTDWAHWPVVKERRAAILGGTPREQARARIEKTFAMGELTWVQVDQHKQLDSMAARIRAGGVDLLLLLQSFASHKASDKLVEACRDAGVPFVPIEHGYGVARIQRAIEEHVGGRHLGAPPA